MKINIQKNVLIAPELAHTLTVRVKNTGLTADDEGKKIILAGTLIGGTTDALTDMELKGYDIECKLRGIENIHKNI